MTKFDEMYEQASKLSPDEKWHLAVSLATDCGYALVRNTDEPPTLELVANRISLPRPSA